MYDSYNIRKNMLNVNPLLILNIGPYNSSGRRYRHTYAWIYTHATGTTY